eukprot:3295442-Alexandrium_andersonii.AAC.1
MPHPAACCTSARGKSRTQQAAAQVPEADPARAASHRCPQARGGTRATRAARRRRVAQWALNADTRAR